MKTANSLCLFAPNSQHLVLVSADNRIRIWSTASNSVEHEILTNEIESNITFVNYNPSPSSKKKQEKLVVIGTEKGTIYLWNLSTARVQIKLDQSKDGHTDKITGLVLSPDHSLLYSCSSDGFFCEWNLKTEQLSWKAKKTSEGYSCLVSHTVDNKINVIATASTVIKTWDLQNNKNMTKKLTGHSAAVQHMKFSKDGKYLISSSKDRFVYLWNLSSESNAPLQSFTCDGSPSQIDFNNFSKSQDLYYLLAVSENSSVNLWKYHSSSSNQGKAKALKPDGKVNCSTSDILSCQFYNDSQLIVASGTAAKPKFDKLEFVGKDGDLVKLSEVSSKSNIKGSANNSEEKSTKTGKESVSVIGEANMPIANSHVLEEILIRSDIHLQKSDLTLEEKLESLGLNPKSAASTTATSSNLIPKANSMHTVLIQGLHTKDRTLLESCLEIKDITIIKNTVSHLPSSYVFSFLSFLVDKFQNKPSRVELVLWLRTVLLVHTSYLITIPDLVKALSPLYVTLDNRTNTFPKLLKLHGRLELLLAQVTPLASAGVETQQNAAVYEEEFSDDEENEDEPMDNEEDEEDLMEEDDK